MENSHRTLWVAVIVVAIIAIIGWFNPAMKEAVVSLAGNTNFDSLIINEDGLDEDSRFEGANDSSIWFLDAGNDSVSADLFTSGGGVNGCFSTTTTAATETLTGANLEDYRCFRFLGSATAAAITVTLQATSSWPSTLLPNAGDRAEWVIENGYTAAATTTTIAAGTGIDLQEPDGQNVVVGINNYAWLTCFREASTDVVCRIDETIPAD